MIDEESVRIVMAIEKYGTFRGIFKEFSEIFKNIPEDNKYKIIDIETSEKSISFNMFDGSTVVVSFSMVIDNRGFFFGELSFDKCLENGLKICIWSFLYETNGDCRQTPAGESKFNQNLKSKSCIPFLTAAFLKRYLDLPEFKIN